MVLIQVYVQTTDAGEEEVDTFYGQVQSEINKICKVNILLVVGNWNKKMELVQSKT